MNRGAGYRVFTVLLNAAVGLALVMLAWALWERRFELTSVSFRLWTLALVLGIVSTVVRLPAGIRVLEIFIKLAALILVGGLWLVVTGRLTLA